MSQFLKTVFVVHAVFCFACGVFMYVAPTAFAALIQWPVSDPLLTRFYGTAVLGLGLSSLLGYRAAHWDEVRILVDMEIAVTVLGCLAIVFQAFLTGVPAFAWVMFLIWLAFAVAWVRAYRHATAPSAKTAGGAALS